MELLDVYNENHEMIGTYPRDEVHDRGLWHNTVHCWIYDDDKNVYYQVRSDDEKLYTTASGHVQAGETIKEAFGRETKEEIGLDVDYEKAELIRVNNWKMDKIKNGKTIKDRAFANIYILNIGEESDTFSFQDGEVLGVAKVNCNDVLKLFQNEVDNIQGIYIDVDNKKIKKTFTINDFLLWNGEVAMEKYGYIMEAIKRK